MFKKIHLGAILAVWGSCTAWSDGVLSLDLGSHVASVRLIWTYSNGTTIDYAYDAGFSGRSRSGTAAITVQDISAENGYGAYYTVLDSYNAGETFGPYKTGSSYVPLADYSAVTIQAQASPLTNSITYVLDGGQLPSSYPTTYTVEDADINLPSPNKVGNNFLGWYDNAEFAGSKVEVIPTGSTSNKTFYAKWAPLAYEVTLNFDGGWISVNGDQVTDSPFVTNYVYGAGLTLPNLGRLGHASGGWHYVSDGSDPAVSSIGTTEMGDRELYAKFTAIDYTITLDNQGADISGTKTVKVAYDGIPSTIFCPERAGYDFYGYFAETDGRGTQYYTSAGEPRGNTWNTAANGTIYAYWVPHAYTLSFEAGEGTGVMAPMDLTYGVETNLPPVDFAKEGYVFAGWKTNLTAGATFADGQAVSNLTTVANGAVTMIATWAKGRYYVAFDANGGEGDMEAQAFSYDIGAALSPNDFERVGHDFVGWSWQEHPTTNDINYVDCQVVTNLPVAIDSTNTLHAVWKPEEYEVVLHANGGRNGYFPVGDGTSESIAATVAYGDGYASLPSPSNSYGWLAFDGWRYVDPETGALSPLPATVPLQDAGVTNLVAQWTDGLAAALNAEGTDLEYVVATFGEGVTEWLPAEKDGTTVGQSGALPAVDSSYGNFRTILRTALPGPGVLNFRWKMVAPAASNLGGSIYGNVFRCIDADSGSNLAEPLPGTGVETEWLDVSVTNSAQSLAVEWRFEFNGGVVAGGGTGWVDNVTWTPAGGLKPGKVPLGENGTSPMTIGNGQTTVCVANTVQGWWYGLYSKTNLADTAEGWTILPSTAEYPTALQATGDDVPISFAWPWNLLPAPRRFFKIMLSEGDPRP